MPKLEVNRLIQGALILLTAGIVATVGIAWFRSSETERLTLAAGSATGESYILSSALKKVVERHYRNIRIAVLETGGTSENLRMIEDGRAQLATAQADVLAGPSARCAAVLYDDDLQLLVHGDSPIRSFVDLRGRNIALARTGGQYQSFLQVAEHFGLRAADFRFIGADDASAEAAFRTGAAGAIFRVRALGNPSVRALTSSENVRFIPIEQAAAMKIGQPAFEPAVIPKGAYRGNPAVPDQDLPTVAIHRYLLASASARDSAIRAITGVLIERRQEVMAEIPRQMTDVRLLLAQVRRPRAEAGLGPPLHPGALSFYDKDKPSFLQANADFVGLLLTVALMVGSWIWELKRWMQRQQKNNADRYSNRAIELMTSAQSADSAASLDSIWTALLTVLTEAVHDLDDDKLSEESFASFRSILQIAMDVTRERRALLPAQAPEGPVTAASAAGI